MVLGRWGAMHLNGSVEPSMPSPARMPRFGLYLHVPFCPHLCPFCPYHRVAYRAEQYQRYERALHEEIELYGESLAGGEVDSLYVGGGTATVNLDGLLGALSHIAEVFGSPADVCVELHPLNMDDACLARLRDAGVTMVSIGVQSLDDRCLAAIGRTHDAAKALDACERAVRVGFRTVNCDLMFGLPGQTPADIAADVARLIDVGVDQITTYPLFRFPHTEAGRRDGLPRVSRPTGGVVRSMLSAIDAAAGAGGLQRCSVWSWIRPAAAKFSSVSRHHFVGLGPSAASMIGSHFYLNTFDVEAYARTLPGRRPIAMSTAMSERDEMVYWLYWRLYQLRADEDEFRALFGGEASLGATFGTVLALLRGAGMLRRRNGGYDVTERGAYWIHRVQNEFSLESITRVWDLCRQDAWPDGARV
jgi:oxygen-independent coproporphyrinogen-3 oxidase